MDEIREFELEEDILELEIQLDNLRCRAKWVTDFYTLGHLKDYHIQALNDAIGETIPYLGKLSP